jgi:uncharacterized coiled-coil DUF342 family protein
MTNAELIKALRYCAEHEGCDYYIAKDCPREDTWVCGADCEQILMRDAADALEAAERLLDQNTERCEALRKQLREAHESYEKHINELTTKCNQLQAAVDNYKNRIAELEAQLPREGEWKCSYPKIEPNPMFMYGICSICGFEQSISNKLNYCPNCGARMKGEHDGEQTESVR